jgi:hypothetical protein
MFINNVSLSFPITKKLNQTKTQNAIIDPLPPDPKGMPDGTDRVSFGLFGGGPSLESLLVKGLNVNDVVTIPRDFLPAAKRIAQTGNCGDVINILNSREGLKESDTIIAVLKNAIEAAGKNAMFGKAEARKVSLIELLKEQTGIVLN